MAERRSREKSEPRWSWRSPQSDGDGGHRREMLQRDQARGSWVRPETQGGNPSRALRPGSQSSSGASKKGGSREGLWEAEGG